MWKCGTALAEAHLTPGDISYVSAHAGGPEADDEGLDGGAAGAGMIGAFEDDDAGAFTGDHSVAVCVEGAQGGVGLSLRRDMDWVRMQEAN